MTGEERLRRLVRCLLRAQDGEARHWAADDLAGELVQRIEDHRDTSAELADEVSSAIPWLARENLEAALERIEDADTAAERVRLMEFLEQASP